MSSISQKTDSGKKARSRITEWKVLAPFLSDYRARFHGRQLAGMLSMSHVTIAWTLKRLEKDNILRAEQEGRNKKYFLNLGNISTKDYIGQAESLKTGAFCERHFIFKKMREEFTLFIFRDTPVVLFGSYAKGSQTEESDVDILVLGNGNARNVIKALKEFGERHKKKLQIQTMTQKDFESGLMERDTLIMEILKNHVILNNVPVIIDILWRHYNVIR